MSIAVLEKQKPSPIFPPYYQPFAALQITTLVPLRDRVPDEHRPEIACHAVTVVLGYLLISFPALNSQYIVYIPLVIF